VRTLSFEVIFPSLHEESHFISGGWGLSLSMIFLPEKHSRVKNFDPDREPQTSDGGVLA
jgi:hypothetical protein